jgi:hypothetical protein
MQHQCIRGRDRKTGIKPNSGRKKRHHSVGKVRNTVTVLDKQQKKLKGGFLKNGYMCVRRRQTRQAGLLAVNECFDMKLRRQERQATVRQPITVS